jgi:hypothetical protein
VTALIPEEVVPDQSIAVLEKRWGISRNGLKARAKALAVDPQGSDPDRVAR